MSDSEDDFMSDKFLVDAPSETTTYSSRRKRAAAAGAAKAKANEVLPLREREVQRRREGLNKSLFDDDLDSPRPKKEKGQAKAMDLMMKMGWKVGEGLGRRRSASPDRQQREGKAEQADRKREGEERRGGLGSSSAPGRAEPVRISMWAGRKGLAARSPSPPPLNRGEMTAQRLEELANKASSFRGRWGAEANQRDTERKAEKARELLVEMDAAKGVTFHPLHAQPGNPEALPRPLLRLLYPDLTPSPTSSPKGSPPPSLPEDAPPPVLPRATATASSSTIRNNVNKAEQLREQMRREMLSSLGGVDEGSVRFGVPSAETNETKEALKAADEQAANDAQVDWPAMVSGTKRVLSMTPEEYLAFVVSQLRNEHMFCFWCGSKYASFAEMDGPGGCPGEDEDDH